MIKFLLIILVVLTSFFLAFLAGRESTEEGLENRIFAVIGSGVSLAILLDLIYTIIQE